jgi:pimeloyl-ACP methyl ester carboxylesterase
MAKYVLVHGAWHGAWCWQRVRAGLTARGHAVFTPTLTGVADRSHLASTDVDLDTHIADVVNLIEWEGLDDVILCGHSYGGCVVTGVADRLAERIGTLVYLDAFVPGDGQSLHDLLPEGHRLLQLESAERDGDGWRVAPIPAAGFDVNAADRDWVDRQCTPQPLATFRQPIRLTGAVEGIGRTCYIHATDYRNTPFRPFYEHALARGWSVTTMASGHDVMLDCPAELTTLLDALAAPAN